MKKHLLLLTSILFLSSGFSQNSPTLISYEIDSTCEADTYAVQVFNIQIEDLDMDSTYFNITSYSTGLYYGMTVISPAYNPSATIRNFTVKVDVAFGIPSGLNFSDILIEIHGNDFSESPTTDQISNLAAYGPLNVTFDMSTAGLCSNDQPVDLNNYVSIAGGEFNWGAENHDGNMFDPVLYLEDPSNVNYKYTNSSGCTADLFETPIFNLPATLAMVETASSCGSADGAAQVFITGGTGPYNLYWSTGTTVLGAASSETVSNLSSGTYYANVINTYGCKETIIANISDSNLGLSANPTDPLCFESYDGALDMTISNSTGGNVVDIYWSNGQTTEDLTNLGGGEFLVEVHTDNNCHAFAEFELIAPSKLDIDINNISPGHCNSATNGLIDITTSGGTPFGAAPYLWAWSGGQMSEDISAINSGIHSCTVTDMNGCMWSWSVNVPDVNGPQIDLEQIVKADCDGTNGVIDVSIYNGANNIISTLWNTGATTEDMINAGPGTYSVAVEDDGGCITEAEFKIRQIKPYQPTICMLTVDTSLIYNLIVWEKDITQTVAGFNVYRETSTVGEYELVAQRPIALESFFQDNEASPVNRSWRYYITSYDACGTESYPSFPHKTIHTVTQSTGPNTDIYWDEYEGLNYSSVDLHRYDDTNGWTTIGSGITIGTNTFPDTPPVSSGLDYLVTFNLTNGCTSTKATDYNSSRSNRTTSSFDPGGTTVELEEEQGGRISIYPNPSNGIVNLFVENPEAFEYFELKDVNGKVLVSENINKAHSIISLEDYAKGVYFISLVSHDFIMNHKVIKQ